MTTTFRKTAFASKTPAPLELWTDEPSGSVFYLGDDLRRLQPLPPPFKTGLPVISSTMRRLVAEVAARRALSVAAIMNTDDRSHPIAHARQEVMWLARQIIRPDRRHRYSFPQIGRFFPHEDPERGQGFLDHTVIIWGVKQHAKRMRAQALQNIREANAASALEHGEG